VPKKALTQDQLSVRNAEVARLLRKGWTAKAIAVAVGCSTNNITNIKRRLGLPIEGRRTKERPVLKPPIAEGVPLSPAMRHLAQFDPIIRARLSREQKKDPTEAESQLSRGTDT
jgi:hypothetical protein